MGTKQSQPKQAKSNDKVSYRVLVQPNSEHLLAMVAIYVQFIC